MNNFKYFFVLGLIGTFLSFNTLYACEVIATFQTECEDINPTLAEDEFQIRVQITQGDTNTISITETTSQGVVFIDQGNGEWLSNGITEINTIDIHLTDVNDCSGGFDITGIQKQCSCPTVATLTATTPTEICDDGSSTVTLELSTQGGAGDYTFSIENSMGITVESEANHSTFPYTFNVNADETYLIKSFYDNGEGCEAEKIGNVDVIVHPLPTATISGGSDICEGQQADDILVDFTGTNPFTFSYAGNPGASAIIEASNQYVISNPGAGTYEVTALTDGNGCSATASQLSGSLTTISHPRPTATISGGGEYCEGEESDPIQITLTGTPPFVVTHSDGFTDATNSGITSSPYTFPISQQEIGQRTYTLVNLFDANCPAASSGLIGSASVEFLSLPTFVSVTATDGIICSDGSDPVTMFLTFTGEAPITYDYTTPTLGPTAIITSGTSNSHQSTEAGEHTFENIVDENGCAATDAGSYTIIHSDPIIPTLSASTDTVCETEDITLFVTDHGGFPLNWYHNGEELVGENLEQLILSTATESGMYSATVDDGICPPWSSQSDTVFVVLNEIPVVSTEKSYIHVGLDESININAATANAHTTLWTASPDLNGLTNINDDTVSFSPIETGEFNYTLTAYQGKCAQQASIFVSVGAVGLSENTTINPLTIFPNPVQKNQPIHINHDGSGTISVFNGSGQLISESNYSKFNAHFSAPSKSGLYMIQFVDKNGEIFTSPLVIE